MEYSISSLSKLAGVTRRTLRYYDEIGLLKPIRMSNNGYRVYGQAEVDLLQQILFYRELGMNLNEIANIVSAKDFNVKMALHCHLSALISKREQLDLLIDNVKKTILAEEGAMIMNDKDKFAGFKEKMISDNEEKYGKEIRAKYGDYVVDKSNSKFQNMTQEQYDEAISLENEIRSTLKIAVADGNPGSEQAQIACELHRKWLSCYYPDYSKEYHLGLAEMYVEDNRFKAYYDDIAVGCAEFFRAAINIYCK